MFNVLVIGAGKIGSLIACLLAQSKDYSVTLADMHFQGPDSLRLQENLPQIQKVHLDVSNQDQCRDYLKKHPTDALISCLPYFCNEAVANLAREFNCHYFDLTEDVRVTTAVKKIAEGAKTAFVPQCGLAPGFISIVANTLMQRFDKLDTVKMRVGALPMNTSNALQYSLTWSTDGLINEYGNLCEGVENGKSVILHPLEGLESITIDGVNYEAFNTSGGLGSLIDLYDGRVTTMNYKTIRYPGHCEKMHLLMNDLKLNDDRVTLKRILENAIPKTYQDVVIVYVSVSGTQAGVLMEESYVNRIYPMLIADLQWSAIQITTAAGICGVIDLVLENKDAYQGFVYQEQFMLEDFLTNRFGQYYGSVRS